MEGPQVPIVTERPLCLTNTEFVLLAVENKKQSRMKNGSIWNMLSSLATFNREVLLCGEVTCSKADYKSRWVSRPPSSKLRDLLRGTAGRREQGFNPCSMMCLDQWIFVVCDVEHKLKMMEVLARKTKEAHPVWNHVWSEGNCFYVMQLTWSSVSVKPNWHTPTD